MSESSIAKNKSVWKKDLKVNFKPLFLALGKAVAHTASLKFDDLGVDAVEAAASLGIETTSGELVFELLQRSLFDAMITLTRESLSHISKDVGSLDKLDRQIELRLDGLMLKVDKDFFKNPSKLEFMREIEVAYSQWLCDAGVSPLEAQLISTRLNSYFVFSLADEWRKNSKKYQGLLDSVGGPFSVAEDYERAWQAYFAVLYRRVAENVFDEAFSLEQIYIPLNAYCVEKSRDKLRALPGQGFQGKKIQLVVSAEKEIKSWLIRRDPTDAIRVISGGPGSGKSSFTKILCANLAREGIAKPVYIPLHLIDPTREIAVEVEKFIRDEGVFGFNPLDPERKEDKLFLVFDGLDELASQGKVAAQVTKDFVQAVEKMVERRNYGQHPIFVLLSGREIVVQENETEFRKPHQILSLLPYGVPKGSRDEFVDPDGLLDRDLREDWWRKYGVLTGKGYEGFPDSLKKVEIDEITAQPLLNYLVALSFSRGKLEFNRNLNLNSVYADLVAAVHERGYEKSRTFRPISHISADEFLRVLEEIGLAAWHGGDGRSTSVRDIMEHCRRGGLGALLNTFKEGAQAGVTKLLAAFFFRRNGEAAGEDAAFVFTHKSFGEYLTSARLVRGIDRMAIERARRAKNPDDGFDAMEALAYWARLAGPAQISSYIHTFLGREISMREESQIGEWHEVLSELMEVAIDHHLPVERLGDGANFSKMHKIDANASIALLMALNSCAVAIKKPIAIKFSGESSFGTFLRRVCPQRNGPVNHPIYSALSYIDFSGQCFDMFDFYGANLNYSIWVDAKLHFVNFDSADVDGANFSSARMSWSRMSANVISNANFSNSVLNEISFRSVALVDCDFSDARLEEADFRRTQIRGCDFSGADISRSSIAKVRVVEDSIFNGVLVSSEDAEIISWFEVNVEQGNIQGNLIIRETHDLDDVDEDEDEDEFGDIES